MYFNNATKTGIQTNKDFRKLIKPFLTNKRFLENAEIVLAEKDEIVTEEKELARIFNGHYINIVERSCGTKPTNLQRSRKLETTEMQYK